VSKTVFRAVISKQKDRLLINIPTYLFDSIAGLRGKKLKVTLEEAKA
jgi:hypothetical protein